MPPSKNGYEVRIGIYDPITLEIEDWDYAEDIEEARRQARKYKLTTLEQVWWRKDGGRTIKTIEDDINVSKGGDNLE